jgi:hypothetical protein
MNGRFAPAIVAFAVATGAVTHPRLLPEFLVQIHDPNTLGGPVYAYLLQTFGYAIVAGLCAILAAATVLLVAWRTRMRGASDWHAALAAVLVALCLIPRWGVSLDPVGWACAAGFCLLLDRDDVASAINGIAVLVTWTVLQGGATLGALLAVIALADGTNRRRILFTAAAVIIGVAQLHALPWHAYGAHALYLDSLLGGAQRDRIWSGGFSVPGLAFTAMLALAGWYGVKRRARAADAIAFFTLLLLSLGDARNLPYLGIVGAPVVADAVASFYVNVRTAPVTTVRQHFVTFAACAIAFAAILAVTEPKVTIWPEAPGEPAVLLKKLGADSHAHRLLCTQPRWCDGVHLVFAQIHPFLDDRAGLASMRARRVQVDVVHASGAWRKELHRAGIDAIIAGNDEQVVALLASTGWRAEASDGTRVLLRPRVTQ